MEKEKNGLLIVISGPAGSGKGTLIAWLLENDTQFAYSVSATSRPRLANEQDGVNYWYLTREEFEARIRRGEMLEYTEYCGNYYGTPLKEATETLASGRHLILEIEVEGAMQIKKKFPDALLIMILPPSHKKQEERLRSRGRDSEEQILRRLEVAKRELTFLERYDYVVINRDGEVEQAAADLLAIVRAETLSVRRNPNIRESFLYSEL